MIIMKIDYNVLGKQIKKFRKEKGLSQAQLSQRINKSTIHISKIERGVSKCSLQTLVDIANALNKQLDELLYTNVKKTFDRSLNNDFEKIFMDLNINEKIFLMDNIKFFKNKLKEMQENNSMNKDKISSV